MDFAVVTDPVCVHEMITIYTLARPLTICSHIHTRTNSRGRVYPTTNHRTTNAEEEKPSTKNQQRKTNTTNSTEQILFSVEIFTNKNEQKRIVFSGIFIQLNKSVWNAFFSSLCVRLRSRKCSEEKRAEVLTGFWVYHFV